MLQETREKRRSRERKDVEGRKLQNVLRFRRSNRAEKLFNVTRNEHRANITCRLKRRGII